MCDICKKKSIRKIVPVDVTEMALKAIEAIEKGKKKTQSGKCTPLQLLEAWIGRNQKMPKLGDLRVATKEDCERIVVEMILTGYLTQTHQAAQYGYNSYLQPGPRSRDLIRGKDRLEITFEVKEKRKPVATVALMAEEEDAELNAAYDTFQEYEDLAESLAADLPSNGTKEEEDVKEIECVAVENGEDVVCLSPKKKTDALELDFGDSDAAAGSSRNFDYDFSAPPGLKRSISGGASGQKKKRGLF